MTTPQIRTSPRPHSSGRTRLMALIAPLVAIVFAGCSSSPDPLTQSAEDQGGQSSVVGETVDLGEGGEEVVIGLTYVPNVQFAPVYVAGSDEIFRAAGIGASIRHHGADEGLFTALMAGDEDVTVASGDEVLQARAAGMDLVAIGAYYHHYPVVIITREDTGITTVADLKGKTVGLPGEFGSNWFGLLAALNAADMTPEDITVVPIGYTQAASLASGQVDAVVGFVNSDVVQLEQLEVPITVIPLSAGEVPLVGATIVTTNKWAEDHPHLASGVVGAITAGTDRVLANPQHALEVTALWDPALEDPAARQGASKLLAATLPLWEGADGKASAVQDLELWEAMAPFLSGILDVPVKEMGVEDGVTNEFAGQ